MENWEFGTVAILRALGMGLFPSPLAVAMIFFTYLVAAVPLVTSGVTISQKVCGHGLVAHVESDFWERLIGQAVGAIVHCSPSIALI